MEVRLTMKKIAFLAAALVALVAVNELHAETKDYETFCTDLMMNFEGVEFVSYDVYKQWNGDSDAFIKFYTENGQCYGEN